MRPWDGRFQAWIDAAAAQGRDPNDVGDEEWTDPRAIIQSHYRPLFGNDSVVMELGPGSGRVTRHLMPQCKEMILVDYSEFVCDWLRSYFKDKGKFRVVHAKDYTLEEIRNDSVDAIVAHGVFEHIYLEGFYNYLETFARILKPGAKGCFNYNNIMSSGGFDRFVNTLPKRIDERSIFRFYHPETVERLCSMCGLETTQTKTSDSRFAFLTFRKPLRSEPKL